MTALKTISLKHIGSIASASRQNEALIPLHPARVRRDAPHTRQVEISPLHDFMTKLRQPELLERLKAYVRWQAAWRDGYARGVPFEEAVKSAPRHAPVSINLDVTTACNYRCDHCVDMDILNTGIRYDHDKLKDSLSVMAENGLKSVIVIGGGEPTTYPGFEDIIRHLKSLNQRIGIVTNGSLLKKIKAVADCLTPADWVRLSLDSGSNETFYAMHKPGKKSITLDWICEGIRPIKEVNPNFQIGYSYIIVWNDCTANETAIVENIDEMVMAAERAKQSGFDYISYKPFLVRSPVNNAEIVDLVEHTQTIDPIMARIQEQLDQARAFEDDRFRIVESTNLRVYRNGSYRDYTDQPVNCHMQYFRQVLSPLGVFNCPVYRNVSQALVGDKHAYHDQSGFESSIERTLKLIETFDAHEQCKHVTCLYNHANWFIEDLVENPEMLDALTASESRGDFFL
jgi:wyosine [tRNA(Phe)-imidazoG37] synthetase (radical SAM superfamily)